MVYINLLCCKLALAACPLLSLRLVKKEDGRWMECQEVCAGEGEGEEAFPPSAQQCTPQTMVKHWKDKGRLPPQTFLSPLCGRRMDGDGFRQFFSFCCRCLDKPDLTERTIIVPQLHIPTDFGQ